MLETTRASNTYVPPRRSLLAIECHGWKTYVVLPLAGSTMHRWAYQTHDDQPVPWPWRRYIWNLSIGLRGVHTERMTSSGSFDSSRRKSVQPSSEAYTGRCWQRWAESTSTACCEKAAEH